MPQVDLAGAHSRYAMTYWLSTREATRILLCEVNDDGVVYVLRHCINWQLSHSAPTYAAVLSILISGTEAAYDTIHR